MRRCVMLVLAGLFWTSLGWAGPRLIAPLGDTPTVLWGTYQEDTAGNQLPLVLELYTRFRGEVLTVRGLRNSEGFELTFVGPDAHVRRSTVSSTGRPVLHYVSEGQRGWGVLIVQDNQGQQGHADIELSIARRRGATQAFAPHEGLTYGSE